MPLRPSFDEITLGEAAWLLQGLYLADIEQLRSGIPPILAALRPDASGRRELKYIRRDPRERWQTIRGIWARGGGDCEDLAAGGAAELTLAGLPCRPVIRPPPLGGGTAHALIEITAGPRRGELLDPSRLGGMGSPRELAEYRAGVILDARAFRVRNGRAHNQAPPVAPALALLRRL